MSLNHDCARHTTERPTLIGREPQVACARPRRRTIKWDRCRVPIVLAKACFAPYPEIKWSLCWRSRYSLLPTCRRKEKDALDINGKVASTLSILTYSDIRTRLSRPLCPSTAERNDTRKSRHSANSLNLNNKILVTVKIKIRIKIKIFYWSKFLYKI